MKYYYYPLCTKDFTFENIFASESISPYNFYSERGFGISYFYQIPKVHNNEALILYNAPPKFETGISNASILKFILEINENSIDTDGIINISDNVIAYQKTVYLDRKNFNILFFSETDKKITCLKSETSLPTKGLVKYKDNFKVISENDCTEFDLASIQSLKLDNLNLKKELVFDKVYNLFKGFIYGIVGGITSEKPKEEVLLRRSFRSISNCFAEYKNRYEVSLKESGTKNIQKIGSPPNSIKIFEERLRDSIKSSENLYYELFPDQFITEEDIAIFLTAKHSKHLPSKEEALRYLTYKILDDEIFGTNKFSEINRFFLKASGKKDPSIYFGILKEVCGFYFDATKFNSYLERNIKEDSNERFKNAILQLSTLVNESLSDKSSMKQVDLKPIYFNFNKNVIEINSPFMSLTEYEIKEFLMIVNSIFKSPKIGKGETKKENILGIVEDIGNKTSKNLSGKLTHLYRYLNNEVSEYSLEKASSIVMKNFVAFSFNPDSLEKLDNYIESKGIEEKWIGCSFWCVFNGFANTSRNLLDPIFNTENEEIQDYIDIYLRNCISNIVDASNDLISLEKLEIPLSIDNSVQPKTQNEASNKNKEFYEKYLKGRYEIPFEQFNSIIQNDDKEQIINELKEKGRIFKKDGKKLVNSYKEFISTTILF